MLKNLSKYKNSNYESIKLHYKGYCKILTKVIIGGGGGGGEIVNLIINSKNKIKTVWKIVKNETNNK
jgi:hypothetical protein